MVDINDVMDTEVETEKYTQDDFNEAITGLTSEESQEEIQEGEQEEEKVKQVPKMTKEEEQATVSAIVEIVGNVIAKLRHLDDPEDRREFLEEYHHMSDQVLILIGFGKAIASLPISEMKPTTVILLGLGLLVIIAFMIRIPQKPKYTTHNPPPAKKPKQPRPESKPGPSVLKDEMVNEEMVKRENRENRENQKNVEKVSEIVRNNEEE